VCDGDAGEVVLQPAVGAALVMVEPEALLELAIVMLDAPAELGEVHKRLEGGIGG
jgi:hypothetical protein